MSSSWVLSLSDYLTSGGGRREGVYLTIQYKYVHLSGGRCWQAGRALEGYIRDGVRAPLSASCEKKDGFGQSLSNAICTFPWRWDSWRIGFLSPKGPCWAMSQSACRLGLHQPPATNAAFRGTAAGSCGGMNAPALLGRYCTTDVNLEGTWIVCYRCAMRLFRELFGGPASLPVPT
jgi:hypothetical protein